MLLDILFVICVVLAVIKGFSRGLIVGVFSLVAIVVGLAAAMKLSTIVAGYVGDTVNISQEWLPVISFALVFIGIVLLIRLAANAIQKGVELITLGWLNRLGGIIFYLIIYITVFSVLIFYAEQVGIIKPKTIADSRFYSFIQPWGPKAIEIIGAVLPFFRDMFSDLEQFFDGVSKDLESPAR